MKYLPFLVLFACSEAADSDTDVLPDTDAAVDSDTDAAADSDVSSDSDAA